MKGTLTTNLTNLTNPIPFPRSPHAALLLRIVTCPEVHEEAESISYRFQVVKDFHDSSLFFILIRVIRVIRGYLLLSLLLGRNLALFVGSLRPLGEGYPFLKLGKATGVGGVVGEDLRQMDATGGCLAHALPERNRGMRVIAGEGCEEDADVVGLSFLKPVVREALERSPGVEDMEDRLTARGIEIAQPSAHGTQSLEIGGIRAMRSLA